MSAHEENTTGRKRALAAGGALLGAAALLTSAAFTDWGALNLGGAGGFGGAENAYNLQFSAGQENTYEAVPESFDPETGLGWQEAQDSGGVDVVNVAGADALVPGGESLLVNIPVLNASPNLASDLSVTLLNITEDPTGANAAFANLMRIRFVAVENASTGVPTSDSDWTSEWLSLTDFGTAQNVLDRIAAGEGTVVVFEVRLADVGDDDGDDNPITQADVNAANGGGIQVQAHFDGESID